MSIQHQFRQPATYFSVTLLALGAMCLLLSSPKWLFPLAPWLGPACFLYYSQYSTVRRKWLWLTLTLMLATALSQLGVMPFPWFVLVGLVAIESMKTVALYALHRWLTAYRFDFGQTLLFPALWTVREFWETQGGAGTFASVANTQYAFPWLVQLVSVTGLWGITFLLYWFSAVVVWVVRCVLTERSMWAGAGTYAAVITAVLGFGAYRYQNTQVADATQVVVGGISLPNAPILNALYMDYAGQSLPIPPRAGPGSSALQAANQALAAFIEEPDTRRFGRGLRAMERQQDALFELSERAVARGAKLLVWSEANALLLKSQEASLIGRGQSFAVRHGVWLLMPIGALLPGKLTPGRLFLENKTVLINPQGQVVNTFFKNHPVPMAEPSPPGDGIVPAIATGFGLIAPSICYDADHIGTMRQVGQKRIGLLLLPSGDWHAIAPYHSYMAVFRAVENGCSLARVVSGGLSVFTDYRGRLLASRDAFAPGDNVTVVSLPVASVSTLYSNLGDWLAYGCIILLVFFLVSKLIR